MNKIFHHYIKDKNGNIEMEIFYQENSKGMGFSVHFPRFENADTCLKDGKCFVEFYSWQLSMLLFAYSEEEFRIFEMSFNKWRKENLQDFLMHEQ